MHLNNTFSHMNEEKDKNTIKTGDEAVHKLFEAFDENQILEEFDPKSIELALKKVELDLKNIRRALKAYRKSTKPAVLKG